MSVNQYQMMVNNYDREIAALEKKKAQADNQAANEAQKAARVTFGSNISIASYNSKMRQIQTYETNRLKAQKESADLQKQIADKRSKRNEAYSKLQQEEKRERAREKRNEGGIRSRIQFHERNITDLIVPPRRIVDVIQNVKSSVRSEYDVFVSHASEDKESFVDEFVQVLKNRNLRVWYDALNIEWGDSLRAKIDEGLRRSRFGVVILSPDYIDEGKYWTKAELNGLFQLESVNGKALLPIWHRLTKKEVMDFSPIIADRNALKTADMTPEEIADKLVELLREDGRSN